MSEGPAATPLAARAARGAKLALAGQVVTHGLRLASNLILARLLEPDAFGLILLLTTVTMGLYTLSDLGLWQAVVQSKREDRDFRDTAWTLGVLRGLLVFAVGCAAALPASLLYERPEVLWLLPLCALQAVLYGLESTRSAELQRQLMLGRLIGVELLSQVLALAAAVPIALATRSVLALVAAAYVALVVRVVASHTMLPGARNRFRMEKGAVRELVGYGAGMLLSAALVFLGGRWDVFALGKLLGMGTAGIYGLALLVLGVPAQVIDRAMNAVLLPALAERLRDAPARFAGDVVAARRLVLPAAALLLLGAALLAPAFFQWLYREAFHDAGWIAQLAVVAVWFTSLQEAGRRALMAVGATRTLAFADALRLLATVAGTSLGFSLFGLVGFLVGNAVGAAVGALAMALLLRRLGARVIVLDVLASAAFLALLAAGCLVPRWLAEPLGVAAPTLSVGVALLLVGPLAALLLRRARAASATPARS